MIMLANDSQYWVGSGRVTQNGPMDNSVFFCASFIGTFDQCGVHSRILLLPFVSERCSLFVLWIIDATGIVSGIARRGLCNGPACVRSSVRPCVCPIDRQQQRRPAGLLLSDLPTGDIDSRRRRSAANAGKRSRI